MIAFVLTLCVAAGPWTFVSDGPTEPALLTTASELHGGDVRFNPAEAADYDVSFWGDRANGWRVGLEDDVLTIRSLGSDDPVDAKLPAWSVVGTLNLEAGRSIAIRVENPEADDSTPGPVPTLLAIQKSGTSPPESALDVLRGRIHVAAPSPDDRRMSARTNEVGVDYEPPDSLNAWNMRADQLRRQLRVTLGLVPELPRPPLNVEFRERLDRDGYTIENVVLETLPGFFLSGSLYRPTATSDGPRPAILCPHGHYEVGRMHPDVQMRCIRWAKLGCVVFVYDMVGYNDSEPFGHDFQDPRLELWGLNLATLQTWNSLRAVDFLATLPDVDATRIGCTGSSGGATQTILLTALEPRIRASAPVVMVSEGYQGGCFCENAPGLRVGTDNVEIAALAAPRPLKLVGATGDWTVNTTSVVLPKLRSVYELFGAPDLIEANVFTYPHNYNKTSREAVYPFLARHLLGLDDPESTREGEQSAENASVLLAFDDEHPRPSDARTPAQLESDLIRQRSEAIGRLAPGDDPVHWGAAREVLDAIRTVRVGIEVPAGQGIEAVAVRRADREGQVIEHWRLTRPEAGDAIPVVRISPRDGGRGSVILSLDDGKAGLIAPDGSFRPIVRELLDHGLAVIGYDPLFVGESFDAADPQSDRAPGEHVSTYNRTLAGERLQDLATVSAWAASEADWAAVHLIAEGDSAALAILARPSLPMLGRSALMLDEPGPNTDDEPLPNGLALPGLFQFGGLPAAAALCAPSPLWIGGANSELEGWPGRAYRLAGAESQLRITAEPASPADLASWIAGEDR